MSDGRWFMYAAGTTAGLTLGHLLPDFYLVFVGIAALVMAAVWLRAWWSRRA